MVHIRPNIPRPNCCLLKQLALSWLTRLTAKFKPFHCGMGGCSDYLEVTFKRAIKYCACTLYFQYILSCQPRKEIMKRVLCTINSTENIVWQLFLKIISGAHLKAAFLNFLRWSFGDLLKPRFICHYGENKRHREQLHGLLLIHYCTERREKQVACKHLNFYSSICRYRV